MYGRGFCLGTTDAEGTLALEQLCSNGILFQGPPPNTSSASLVELPRSCWLGIQTLCSPILAAAVVAVVVAAVAAVVVAAAEVAAAVAVAAAAVAVAAVAVAVEASANQPRKGT